MESAHGASLADPFDVAHAAVVGIDADGMVDRWSHGAQLLLGYRAEEVIGCPAAALLTKSDGRGYPLSEQRRVGDGWEGQVTARHRDGHGLELGLRACPLFADGGRSGWLAVVTEVAGVRRWERDQAVFRGLFEQSPIGLAVVDPEMRYLLVNPALERMDRVPAVEHLGRRLGEVVPGDSEEAIERQAKHVLATGEPLLSVEHIEPPDGGPVTPGSERVTSGSSFPLQDRAGQVLGVCHTELDITHHYRTRQRLALLNEASGQIGTTLDLSRTADELAEVIVPRVADFVAVDLLGAVLSAHDLPPGPVDGDSTLYRGAHRSIHADLPEAVVGSGEPTRYHPASPQSLCLATGRPVFHPVLDPETGWKSVDPLRMERLRALGVHSRLVVPLQARGVTMGVVTLLRWKNPEPLGHDDLLLVEELVTRAAVCVDNARRFTREHNAALTLQRSLLPHHLPNQSAVEVAHRYLPADAEAGVGGDWFDVIPLSGARVALVVGDVVGHGLHAAATMGRLRTGVQTLADLDLPPDELLAHLDDLVVRLSEEAEKDAGPGSLGAAGVIGASCAYAVYDPISRKVTVARAGHPPPAVARLTEPVSFPDIPAGPPLGLGGLPFESAEFELEEGSVIAFYTDGLIEASDRDVDVGFERLAFALAHPDRPLEEICGTMVRTLLPGRPRDDVAFLIARVHALDCEDVVSWDMPADPAAVSRARRMAERQLAVWGLEDASFVTELIVSELVTNAIRYSDGPINLRLIRDRSLICEVSDSSNTSPHLRRALGTDEGGRGLFLVAQMAQRWGTRYTAEGKTIWAEQPLPRAG